MAIQFIHSNLFLSHTHRLSALKSRICDARMTAPLFDTQRYTRDLEVLFYKMWDIFEKGLPPDHILS